MRGLPVRRAIATSFVALIAFSYAFWVYGVFRTLGEWVGFDFARSLWTFAFGIGMLGVLVLPWLLIKQYWFPNFAVSARTLTVSVLTGFVLGSVAAELQLLHDERQFFAEVHVQGEDQTYSRERAWPHELCSLVYVPGHGVHATD